MYRIKTNLIKKILFGILLLVGVISICLNEFKQEEDVLEHSLLLSTRELAKLSLEENLLSTYVPIFSFVNSDIHDKNWMDFFVGRVKKELPIYEYGEEMQSVTQVESTEVYDWIMLMEGRDEHSDKENTMDLEEDLKKAFLEENQSVTQPKSGSVEEFIPNNQKIHLYDLQKFQSYEELMKEFYVVDSTTIIDNSQLNLNKLLEKKMSLVTGNDKPQILIYHTHSQEDFIDSVPGDKSTTIMGAGEILAQLLREKYGFNVIHHEGEYDVESRDYAYTNSAPGIEQVLAENPSIEVIIDLHRDAVNEDRKLVIDINGKPTAKFMFFNGLSRTRQTGNIEYLKNPYIDDNLAFSFQMQLASNEYYPGLTRKIYLKGYRYNMQYRPKSLLIELGAQTNTVEEIMNACEPLAHILSIVLSETQNPR